MSTTANQPWSQNPKIVDLMDMDIFTRTVPHDKFKILRNQYPVYWNEEEDPEPGFWCITKYDDIVAVSNDTDTYSSAQGINIYYERDVDPAITGGLIGNMITMDPPMHTTYRKIAAPFFTLSAIQKLEPRIRELTNEILDEVAPRGECEFMQDVAAKLPIAMICEIMGVPESDHGLIFDWSNKMIGLEDPELVPIREEGFATIMQVYQYGQEMVAERRKHPKDDLITAMAQAMPEDSPVPPMLLDGFFLLMVIAGNETTRNTISGGMQALIEHPGQRRKLLDDPGLIPTAVEEILRWVSPVVYMRRTATRDTELRGVSIAEGDKVVMWYPAANRDEEAFANPDTFDVTRDPNPHLAFGIGRHRCLGARLAQLQLRIIFTELLRRFPDMEITGDVTRVRTNFINGIKKMPVKFTSSQ